APFAIARSLAPGHKLVATRGALACAILLTGAFLLFARLTPTQPGAPQAVAARDTTLLIGFFILALPLDLLPRRKGAAVAGLLFAAGHGLRFGFHPLAFLLAPLGALAGEATGEAIGRYVKEPTPRHTALAMGLLTFALPPMFGMIDIYLRLWF
ncbi:MAG: hypothetical protein HY558_01125, partial [Euryarchaeota archaeon]|nr:hypothetical protein [Euryarchaeota archaeon]